MNPFTKQSDSKPQSCKNYASRNWGRSNLWGESLTLIDPLNRQTASGYLESQKPATVSGINTENGWRRVAALEQLASKPLLPTNKRTHCPAQRPVLVEHDHSSKPYSLSRDDKCHPKCFTKLLYCRSEARQQITLHEDWQPLVHSHRHRHKLARVAKDDKQHCKHPTIFKKDNVLQPSYK